MFRVFLTMILCLTALSAQAKCRGVDMRSYLNEQQLSALQREVANVPYRDGNHWVATRNGRAIHVVGTMHINDSRMNKVMRNLTPIIRQADAILLEVSYPEGERFWSAAKDHKSLFYLPKGPTVQDLMSDAGWQVLTTAANARHLDMAEIVKLKPWFLSMLLTGSSCGPRGLFAANGLDSRIEKQARRARRPVGSLETVESAIRMLSRQPLADQVRMLQFELTESDSNDHGFITTREAYFDEAMAEAAVMEKWRFYRDFPGSKSTRARMWQQNQNNLLYQRNKNWMPIIERTKGDLLMVAVGAAHLPGQYGVLNLLNKAGYTLTRAPF